MEDGNITIGNLETDGLSDELLSEETTGVSLMPSMELKASVTIYSQEIAKANNLKIYEYLKHLMTELPNHMDETNMDFLEDQLLWLEELLEMCHKKI